MSTNRTRSRRTYGRAPLQLSKLNVADISMLPGVQIAIVCRECRTWRRIVGSTDCRVIGHERDNERGEQTGRCPGGNQQVEVDIAPERWAARLRRQQLDALPAPTRRAATQHYKPLPAQPGPVHLMPTPRPEVEYTSSERIQQWADVLGAAEDMNQRRAEPLLGDIIGPIRGLEVPTDRPSRAA
ncbi:hypothetical protein OHV05_37610 (plasmid) [Kitasatospora sp. NBC_00070]|uniref:hypothetical protein n=1 Tax=Kitasatospora sp. NBC_00070 TaxID=2975962 RepID=UPI002F911043